MDAALRGLPDTLEELIEVLEQAWETGGSLVYELATSVGAVHRCDVCDTLIVGVKSLVDTLAAYYALDAEARLHLRNAVARSGLEIGDNLSPNYCSYHAQITSE